MKKPQNLFRRLELFAWLILLVLAVATRLPELEIRSVSHDESLHSYYSWVYASEGFYRHDPMMHGPLLFHLNALIFRLFGDTDGTARLAPALAGVAAVALAALWRPIIGRLAALLLGALILFSPPLLFYSRYLRNEIYVVFCTQLWVYGIWRYIRGRDITTPPPGGGPPLLGKEGSLGEKTATQLLNLGAQRAAPRILPDQTMALFIIAAAMALSFAAKEVTFIHGLVFGSFLLFLILPIWPQVLRLAAANLVFFHLTLVLPLATAVLLFSFGVNPLDNMSALGSWRIIGAGAGLAIFGWLIAVGWWRCSCFSGERSTWFRCYLLFWAIQIMLYTALFTDIRHGIASCLAGSLGYWLTQHGVGRGGQPAYYYLILLVLYEFLAVGGLIAAVISWLASEQSSTKLGLPSLPSSWVAVFSPRLPSLPRRGGPPPGGGVVISKQRTLFTQFKERLSKNLFLILCLWWFAGNLLFYSLAGEKMPWLLAHISLPLSFIAAIGWSFWLRRPLCSLGFWLAIISLLILAPLSIANCLRATFWHGDLATEPLVYAHGSPDHKIIRAIIAAAAKEGGNTPVVAYGPDCTWPLAWYLRHTPHIFNASSNVQAQCPVIFTGADRFHQKQDYFGPDYTCERLVLILWPIEWWKDGYFLRRVFHDPSAAKKLWELAVTRQCDAKLMHNWPLRTDVLVFLKKGGDFQNDNAIATPR